MMKFRLLGPVEVWAGDDWRAIGAPKWRAVLAALLINVGQVVSTDALIDEVWGDAAPAKAANLISIYVLRLRRLIGDGDSTVLVTRSPGYQLRLAPDEIDAQLFESLVRDGRRALAGRDPQAAAGHLAEALALWHGSALADVPRSPLVEAEAERLAELRLDAAELRITAELDCGGHAQAVPELRRLLTDNPLREGLWVLLMRALNGSGRHAEALDAYGQARAIIADQLGVDPGAQLRRLYALLLAEDGGEAHPPPAAPAGTISSGSVVAIPVEPPARAEPEAPAERPEPAAPPSAPVQAQSPHPSEPGAGRAPAQLPTDISDFTGREDQVKHLSEMLATAPDGDSGAVRIALVSGYGGLGKTSLAVHAAHRVRGSFPDGQLYVDLLGATVNPLTPADVLARFLRDLGVDGRDIPLDEAERAARYRTRLAGRRVLVVLDNARDAAQVRPLLPGSGSCAVLITTRSRMPDLARTRLVDLNVLDDDEALTLFAKVIGDDRATAEPEATAELLVACAGLPLAIRICAARLVTRSGWSIRAMANRLRDERHRLDEMTVGDMAVRASFEVSFASLPTVARGVAPATAFRLLGLWAGSTISAAAAAALFGASEYAASDALEALVDAHLLESVAPDRYKFHDLLRVYASERAVADLAETDRDAAIASVLGWYARTADGAGTAVTPHRYSVPLEPAMPGPASASFASAEEAFGWYDGERANIVAATRQAAAKNLNDIAWRIPTPLFGIFIARDNWTDCIVAHRIALESARAAGNRHGEAWVLNSLGEALGITRDSEGIGYLEQSLTIRREIGDRIGEAQAANNLAEIYPRLGRTDEAVDLLLRGLELSRQAGVRYSEGVALINLGATLLDLDRLDEAAGYLAQARQTFAEIKEQDGIGYAMHCLARCHQLRGSFAAALDCYQQALASHQISGNRHRQAVTLRYLGRLQAANGMAAEANESWVNAISIFEKLGDIRSADAVRAEQDTAR